ncbi:helix-turn-helix domain-containing protein [Symbiopectobacterium purcellii]|uniref:helix-turn-helix domain-containing protein n=1 Tax=Symbiopectobacterium purcellii TaxID=2871826 RepID=UPI003F84C15B
MNTLGERIRARRKDLNLTQRALGKLVGVAHVTISQWESGDSEPGGKNLFSLSKYLQCSPTWILFGDEAFTPQQPSDALSPLSSQEQELLDLFSALPESEKERTITQLREKVEDFNKLFYELLKARKEKK